jgi:DNA-binding XRE family transcriptional regulator
MQTTLPTDSLISERRFQLSTRLRPVPMATIPRAVHARELQRSSPSHSQAPAQIEARPRDISSRFGARLRELRRERNLTQLRMASDFGIDRSFISDVERGRKSISLPMLEVIALGMKISLSDLLQDI